MENVTRGFFCFKPWIGKKMKETEIEKHIRKNLAELCGAVLNHDNILAYEGEAWKSLIRLCKENSSWFREEHAVDLVQKAAMQKIVNDKED